MPRPAQLAVLDSATAVTPVDSSLRRATEIPERLDALDVTKGLLVVLMVVYHSFNYSTDWRIPFRYLSFLPPSFILITGLLLSHVYLARRTFDAALCRRLLARGGRLVLLFIALNVAGQFARSQNYHGPSRGFSAFLDAWPEIFLWGGSRVATFDVLLPIGYLLLLAPALLWLARLHRAAVPALVVVLLSACAWLEHQDECPPNFAFISAGVVGILVGQLSGETLRQAARLLPWSIVAYAIHFVVGQKFGQPILHQFLGALLALTVLYGAAVLAGAQAWTARRLIMLGRYSLLGYIGQIAILQGYSHFLGRPAPVSWALLAMFGITLALTAAGVELAARLEARYRPFRAAYRAVFG